MSAFIVINEAFNCKNCGEKNPPLEKTCRNHCRKCLHSMHLDKDSPGDRSSTCHGLMAPIAVEQDGKKGWRITHKCLKCGKKIPNKSAADDNFDEIIRLAQAQTPPR